MSAESFERALAEASEELRASRELDASKSEELWQAVSELAHESARRGTRRTQLRRISSWAPALVAAAALFVVLGYVLGLERGHDGSEDPVAPEPRIAEAPEAPVLTAPEPSSAPAVEPTAPRPPAVRAGRVFANGATLLANEGAQWNVVVDEPDRTRIGLSAGAVTLRVPRLGTAAELRVETPEARVTVHGTRFTVERQDETTGVRVTEGVVEVRSLGLRKPSTYLRAGDALVVESAERILGDELARVDDAIEGGRFEAALEAVDRYLAWAPEDLDRTPAGFRRAGVLERLGRIDEAVAVLEGLAADATEPLDRENALARIALLSDAAAAAVRWVEYLVAYPTGVHQIAAIELLTQSPCALGRETIDAAQLAALRRIPDLTLRGWLTHCFAP